MKPEQVPLPISVKARSAAVRYAEDNRLPVNLDMLAESQKEALVHQMRQTIEIKTGCDANGRCGVDCLCESAARAILSLELFEHAIYYNKETHSET